MPASPVRQVSVAILSWNGRHHLETCLQALAAQDDPGVPWEILVLDNGSTDGTAGWLRREHPRVRLIESPVNLGFCAGNNRLVDEAQADAVALLNNDTRPQPQWLAALVDALKRAPDDVAAVSGCILDWEGQRLDFGRGVRTFDGHAFQLDFRRPLERTTLPADGEELAFACGGNLLIRRRSFLAAGGFDPLYFAYLEDVDLGWRLWAGGERVVCAPEARVHHRSSATSELLGNFNRGFLFERNAFLTAYKNYQDELWQRMMPAVMLTLMSRCQALLEENNPGGWLLTIDPYAGAIANTPAPADRPTRRRQVAPPEGASRWQRWKRYRPRELVGRGLLKAVKLLWPQAPDAAFTPCLTDPQSVAQLRVHAFLLRHLQEAAASRQQVQARRRRSDREIFERFPAYLVPTYPGDAELFADPGFRAWLPADLPLVESTLGQVMELG